MRISHDLVSFRQHVFEKTTGGIKLAFRTCCGSLFDRNMLECAGRAKRATGLAAASGAGEAMASDYTCKMKKHRAVEGAGRPPGVSLGSVGRSTEFHRAQGAATRPSARATATSRPGPRTLEPSASWPGIRAQIGLGFRAQIGLGFRAQNGLALWFLL